MVTTLVILFALLLLVVALAAYGVAIYNALVGVKHQVDQAWSNIDVLLKQRHDELPKLIDVVKSHAGYERELIERITALRARTGSGGADAQRLADEDALSRGVGRLLATAEAYPELKASSSYLELQRRISGLEEQIAHRREYYNAAVNINNVRMEQFPDALLVGMAGLMRRPLFAAAGDERADVNVGAMLAR
ncbi:MAG TPA: LemA family protein [Burkholderiaceae bacterium]|nr:LemA family protein [Burkholderiaceae bacterium]